jgi:hypothetical protein
MISPKLSPNPNPNIHVQPWKKRKKHPNVPLHHHQQQRLVNTQLTDLSASRSPWIIYSCFKLTWQSLPVEVVERLVGLCRPRKSCLHRVTMLSPPPPIGTQHCVLSSRVITCAFTRTTSVPLKTHSTKCNSHWSSLPFCFSNRNDRLLWHQRLPWYIYM